MTRARGFTVSPVPGLADEHEWCSPASVAITGDTPDCSSNRPVMA
jgi:hypothetical protein